jgi:hypothetical protein
MCFGNWRIRNKPVRGGAAVGGPIPHADRDLAKGNRIHPRLSKTNRRHRPHPVAQATAGDAHTPFVLGYPSSLSRIMPVGEESAGVGPRHPRFPHLSVALSDGGARASLFAVGALAYLVDSGECARVTEICSISGGSITNGFIAQRCDFHSVNRTPDEFDRYAAELTQAIRAGLVSKKIHPSDVRPFGPRRFSFRSFLVPLRPNIVVGLRARHASRRRACLSVRGSNLLRGAVLAHMFQRKLFGFPG